MSFNLEIVHNKQLIKNTLTSGALVNCNRFAKKSSGTLILKITYLVSIYLLVLLLSGCATTSTKVYRGAGKATICNTKNTLGVIAVLPETAWRQNQKEPIKRKLLALEEIKSAFQKFPCGSLSSPGGIKEFSNWSGRSESKLLRQFSKQGINTIIIIRIEELTPYIYFTFSLPILWGGSSEVDFHIRVLSVKTGKVISDMRIRRNTGGPFNVRPAKWSRYELRAALRSIISGSNIR